MICQKRDILGILYLAYIYGNKKKSEQEIVKHVCIKFTFDMKNRIMGSIYPPSTPWYEEPHGYNFPYAFYDAHT